MIKVDNLKDDIIFNNVEFFYDNNYHIFNNLSFEIKTDCAEAYTKQICELMSQAASLDVPLIVEADEGENWEQAH